jgi:hypothetical protein
MIIPPGFAHCRVLFEADGKLNPVITTFGVRLTAGVTNPVTVATGVLTAWTASFPAADLDSNWAVTGCGVTLGSDGGDGPSGEFLQRTAGSRAGEAATINFCPLVRKNTSLGGRRNRGRMFLPAGYLLESEVSELGVLAAAAITRVQGNATDFLTAIEAGANTDAMVILHEAAPSTPTLVDSLSVQTLGATQRKRMRR